MIKKVLVDLSALCDIYSGFGQVALGYINYFQQHYNPDTSGYKLYLLLPQNFFGVLGNKATYLSSDSWWLRHSMYLFPQVDVWHSIHQLSRFRPYSSKTQYILTIHDLNYLYEKEYKAKCSKIHRRLQRKIDIASNIVCISEFARNDVRQNFDLKGKNCNVIYNQVKSLDQLMGVKPKYYIKQPFFFAIGVIMEKKNFHVLLDLIKRYPDKHLYIAGKEHYVANLCSPYAEMIKERIRKENINNVTLLGAVSEEEKIWLYDNCEALLLPSLLEGFGLPMIEAMQFGKPVFSSNKTSLPEIGNRFAFFWDNFDTDSMQKVLDDNLANFYANPNFIAEQINYAKAFTTNRHFEQYEQLYKQ